MKLKLNQKGVSLIELVAGIPIATLLFATLIMAMMHFVKTYQETKLFLQLQDELYQTIEYMRYGYAHETETQGEQMIGLMTARKVYLSPSGNYLQIYPLTTNQSQAELYWTRFTVNDNHHLVLRSQYGGFKSIEPIIIFPKTKFHETQRAQPPRKIGNEYQFKILNPRSIWQIQYDENGEAVMVHIRIEGQVRFRLKGEKQTNLEDKKQNTRSIAYETSVFLGNAQ